jgi:hypothetical protein
MKTRWIFPFVLLALAMTGCIPSQINEADPTKVPLSTLIPAQPTQGDELQMNPFLSTPSASGLEALIEKAKEDLAQRLSISTSDIVLVDAKEVVWSDGSLGCPQPGMMNIQVLTPGYLIVLEYDNKKHEYHANNGTYVIYCPNPIPPIFGTPSNT